MIIKTKLADNTFEIFESNNYKISTIKDMHPMIVKVEVFDNGKKILKLKRPFAFWYKHITFKTEKIQNLLKEIEKQDLQKKEI